MTPVQPRLLILKTGSTAGDIRRLGDFEDWTRAGLGVAMDAVRIVDARCIEEAPPAAEVSGVVITGSPDMITDRPAWQVETARIVETYLKAGVPALGICFGHQLLADMLGGRVDWHPEGREVGTVRIRKGPAARNDPLFEELPEEFPVQSSHAQCVLDLPGGSQHLAASELDKNHAFRFGDAWGVQFHPEFSPETMVAYVEHHQVRLREAGKDPDRIRAAVGPSPAGSILRRFREFAGNRRIR